MKIKLNDNFKKMPQEYLFSEMARRIGEQRKRATNEKIISLGIGDVTRPLPKCVSDEMARAAANMSAAEGFVGYSDARGLSKLRESVRKYYHKRGIPVKAEDVFISDGAKSDLGGLCDLFSDNEIVICDPVYPAYIDSNLIYGRKIRYLSANPENEFLPLPRELAARPYVIYLCSPNNPTGTVFSRAQLKEWVDFALQSGSVIIFDAAYVSFISDKSLPSSVFEIEGARECAIEVCSFSKMAGFTGLRCGWTVIPSESVLNGFWARRQATKFNGASYISQIGAVAALSDEGMEKNAENIDYYMKNARILADFLAKKGIRHYGGAHAPYLWAECPEARKSWELFDYLLSKANVAVTPGIGFGPSGEGYFRLSSFANRNEILEALERMSGVL